MEKQMFVHGDLMDKEWDTGWHIVALTNRLTREKKKEAKWLAGALGRKWELLPSAEVGRKKISCWTEVAANESKAEAPGKGRRKVARTRSHIFKPVLKKHKVCWPVKEEIFSTGIHRNKISKLWRLFLPIPVIYPLSLSLSSWRKTKNERKEKKKGICVHVLFIYNIADTLKMCIYV